MCLLEDIPSSRKKQALAACRCMKNSKLKLAARMNEKIDDQTRPVDIPSDIENRPEELWDLPSYGHLPNRSFQIDLKGSIGEFLANDLFDLDGNQPIEEKILALTNGMIEVNPSEQALEFYKQRGDTFQMISVVICCYAFEQRDGELYGLPYHISIRSAAKRGLPSRTSVDSIRKLDLSRVLEGRPHYVGYNPFSNAFGVYGIGSLPVNEDICSDTVGFVYNTYFLASDYDKNDVCDPGTVTTLFGESNSLLKEYRKYRFSRYFKPFETIDPIKIWGCDSPIELFLLQAMNSVNLRPKIQTYILPDGTTFPTLQSMWEGGKGTKTLSKTITEADFYFEEKKLAVFCDSAAHHSSSNAIAKDAAIDKQLDDIGIRSIRISGKEIMQSPIECANRINKYIHMQE